MLITLYMFSGVRVSGYLGLYVVFCRSFVVLLFFILSVIALSVLLRFTASVHTFGIFKRLLLLSRCGKCLMVNCYMSLLSLSLVER